MQNTGEAVKSPQKKRTLNLSTYKRLSICRVDGTLVAKLMDTTTGHTMTLSYAALIKLMTSVQFLISAREDLLTEDERESLSQSSVALSDTKATK